jgi:hypothetical protein
MTLPGVRQLGTTSGFAPTLGTLPNPLEQRMVDVQESASAQRPDQRVPTGVGGDD